MRRKRNMSEDEILGKSLDDLERENDVASGHHARNGLLLALEIVHHYSLAMFKFFIHKTLKDYIIIIIRKKYES